MSFFIRFILFIIGGLTVQVFSIIAIVKFIDANVRQFLHLNNVTAQEFRIRPRFTTLLGGKRHVLAE